MKLFKGIVTSAKADKTITVLVERKWMHPIYQKAMRRSKKYLVHSEVDAKEGDTVTFKETKPMSRRKKFIIVEIVK